MGRSSEAAVKPVEPLSRPLESGTTAAAAATPGKYVPKFRRERTEGATPVAPPETDRWTNSSSRQDSDRWRSDDRRPAFGAGGGSRSTSTWSSSRRGSDH